MALLPHDVAHWWSQCGYSTYDCFFPRTGSLVQVDRAVYLYALLNQYSLLLVLAVAAGVVSGPAGSRIERCCLICARRVLPQRWECSDTIETGK